MSLVYKKFTKNVGLITIVNLLVVIKGIIFLPLITKMLGVLNYGIWAQLLVTVSLLAPIVRLGLTNSIVRFVAAEKNNEEIKEGVYSALFLIVVLSAAVFLCFLIFINPIANFFQSPTILVGILPIIIFLECVNMTLLSTFQALHQMKKYSFFMILLSLAEIICVVAAIYLGYGLQGAVFALLLAKFTAFLFTYLDIYRTIGFVLPTFHLIRKYLSFGMPTLLSNASYLAVASIDKYLVGAYLGTLFVGYYAPAYSLGNFVTFLIIPISFVLFPAVSKSYDEGKIYEVKTKLRYSLKYFLVISIPTVFGISVLSGQILTLFTTQEISLHAFFITPLVAFSILFYGASDIFSQILTLVKKTKTVGYIWAASAILNIFLNIFLIPPFGILGAAVAALLTYFVSFALIWYYSFREFTFAIDWLSIIKILLCSFAMSLAIWQINPHSFLNLIYSVIIGIVAYGFLAIVTKVFSKKEYNFLKSMLNKGGSF